VVALDTNVLVRVLVGDDPVQTKRAERSFAKHARGEGIFLSLVVLAEVAWVLGAAYDWDRATIHERLTRLVRTRGVSLESLELVQAALDDYETGEADLPDYLILGSAKGAGAKLLTFDRRLARSSGATLLGS